MISQKFEQVLALVLEVKARCKFLRYLSFQIVLNLNFLLRKKENSFV